MATVYLAQDLRHRRKVALKVLRPELSAVIGAERFLKEIETTANLQHPNILPLYDSGEADSFLYYVMPYVEGDTLRGKITREKQLSVEETVSIAKAVAAALEYAHRRGVIHRDIKPENILLPDGQALVADFGIALAVSQAGGTRMTETGLSLGTPHYMSPEQATGDRELSPRSDIYSLGALTYEMLTGDPPHTGSTVQVIIAKVLSEPPTPITRTRQLVPSNVDAAVQRALAKTPADRFGSAAEFSQALSNPGFTLPTMTGVSRGPGATDLWKPRALGLAALLMLAVGVAAWSLVARPAEPPRPVVRAQVVVPIGLPFAAGGPRFALSDDGTRLAYLSETGQGRHAIWVRGLDSLEGRMLPGTLGARSPFFSPDGAWVGFVADGKLQKVRASGGPVIKVADSANATLPGAAWLPDQTIVFTHDDWRFRRVSADGGATTLVPQLDTVGLIYPRALPGSNAVLHSTCSNGCTVMTVTAKHLTTGKSTLIADDAVGAWYSVSGHVVYLRRDGALFAVPFDLNTIEVTGAPIPLFDGVAIAGGITAALALTPDGTLLYQTGSAGGEGNMVRVSRNGTVSLLDPEWPPARVSGVAASPDGSRLAVTLTTGAQNQVWVKTLDRGPLTRLSFEGPRNERPAWTPDGKAVSYQSADTSWKIIVRKADGTGELRRIAVDDSSAGEPEFHAWSPDGAWLVLQTRKAGRRDLHAIKVGTDTVLPIAAAPGVDEMSPELSRDGRWLAYTSSESGRAEVYVRSFPDVSRERYQVSRLGGRSPSWSADGRELYFISEANLDPRSLESVAVTPGATLKFGEPRALFPTTDYLMNAYFRGYIAEPGKAGFLFFRTAAANAEGRFVLVLNWIEELRAKAGGSR